MQDFGVESVRLLTNNPFKVRSLEALDVVVSDVVAHQVIHSPA
jgi:GTP cyclohydrolase II